MAIKGLNITFKDGSTNQISLYESGNQNAPIVLIYPAMGVRASYYKDFAKQLSFKGFHVATVDWRGYGHSNIRASRKNNHGFQVLIDDMDDVINLISSHYPGSGIFLAGHSLGGQISSLYTGKYTEKLNGLILIAASTPYYKAWKEFGTWKLKLGGTIFYPISRLIGYYPGKFFGFGEREARGVMKDWSYAALKGKYVLKNSSYNYEDAMISANIPILSLAVEKDNLGCREAVSHLLVKFKDASVTSIELTSEISGINNLNHFNWAKQSSYLCEIISDWVKDPSKQ